MINRPGGGNTIVNRPGGGNTVINRPGGGGNTIINRPGGDNNIVINRPGRPGYGRPGSGWGYGYDRPYRPNWSDHWHANHVHYHHNWYHGAWGSHYGDNWYVPLVYGATAWGLNTLAGGWGYGYSYSNPYYVAPTVNTSPVYDYAQPISVNNYYETNVAANEQNVETTQPAPEQLPEPTPEETTAFSAFDEAREAFLANNYVSARTLTEQAIRATPNDPVLHEFYALVLFAEQKYDDAAVVLNSLLAVAPGMDWTTMSSLYSDTDTYTSQLRTLEDYTVAHPDDSGAMFVLAYHYMVLDEIDAAIAALQTVVKLKPNDLVARRILTSLDGVPPEESADDPDAKDPASETPDSDDVELDIAGNWQAENQGVTIDLQIKDDGNFVWTIKQDNEAQGEISGPFELSGDVLVLDGGDQGSMVARITVQTADQFKFRLLETMEDDPGLIFNRVR